MHAHNARTVAGRPDEFCEILVRKCIVALLEKDDGSRADAHPYGASIWLTTPAGSWLTHRLDPCIYTVCTHICNVCAWYNHLS